LAIIPIAKIMKAKMMKRLKFSTGLTEMLADFSYGRDF